jgi:hypothetical protein
MTVTYIDIVTYALCETTEGHLTSKKEKHEKPVIFLIGNLIPKPSNIEGQIIKCL